MQVCINSRTELYQSLLWEHRSVTRELSMTQETLHNLQGNESELQYLYQYLHVSGLLTVSAGMQSDQRNCLKLRNC